MKKTLADLKRDAKSGKMFLQLFSRYGKTAEEIPERLQGIRPVVDCNTVAIFLQNRNGEKSEMRLGAASLTDYTGETLTIYNPGKREPNEEEAATLAAAAAARKEYQEKNPYSESYYFMKDYYKKSAFPYLDGFTTAKGKRYTNGLIIDNSIKGEKILVYNVIFAESIEEAEQKAQERTQDAPKTPETIKAGENTTDGEKPQKEQKNNSSGDSEKLPEESKPQTITGPEDGSDSETSPEAMQKSPRTDGKPAADNRDHHRQNRATQSHTRPGKSQGRTARRKAARRPTESRKKQSHTDHHPTRYRPTQSHTESKNSSTGHRTRTARRDH